MRILCKKIISILLILAAASLTVSCGSAGTQLPDAGPITVGSPSAAHDVTEPYIDITESGTTVSSEATDTVITVPMPSESVSDITTEKIYIPKDPSDIKFVMSQESVCATDFSAYSSFLSEAAQSVLVPGLNQYIVPQGMDYWDEMNWLMISGYFSASTYSSSSVIIAIDLESGKMMGEYHIKDTDGSYHTGHAGGIAVTERNLFISNSKSLLRIPLDSFIAAEQRGFVKIVEAIPVPVNASFCNYSGGVLWVGDFQYGTSYPTDSYRHMTTRDNSEYKAWAVGYLLDPATENELKASAVKNGTAVPDYVLSITDRIQGITNVNGKIVLSQSYGRKNDSTLFIYDDPISQAPHTHTELEGVSVPVWFLDSKAGQVKLKAPPMTEGLATVDGKLFVLFESGADKYRNGGGLSPTDRVWKVNIS